jgi:hypothetical protein
MKELLRITRFTGYLRIAILLSPLLFFGTAHSQSGRRASKNVATPKTAPTPAPNSSGAVSNNQATETPKPKTAAKVKLLIGFQHTKKRFATEDVIYSNFVARLMEFTDVSVESIGELTTNEAVKQAKLEEASYVALLNFEIDMVQDGRLIVNSPNLEVNCYVFEPKTGKRLVKDRTYFQPIGGMGSRTGGTGMNPVKITPEAAGASAAEQVRDGLFLVLNAQPSPSK